MHADEGRADVNSGPCFRHQAFGKYRVLHSLITDRPERPAGVIRLRNSIDLAEPVCAECLIFDDQGTIQMLAALAGQEDAARGKDLLNSLVNCFGHVETSMGAYFLPQYFAGRTADDEDVALLQLCGFAEFCRSSPCLFSDLIARTVFAPTELSISSVTAIFGAPIVIWIMIRRRKENG